MHPLTLYLLIINLITFALYGVDKARAKRQAWRISERTLFVLAAIGGSIGALSAILFFHHKTRHVRFVIGIPVIMLLQLYLMLWLPAFP